MKSALLFAVLLNFTTVDVVHATSTAPRMILLTSIERPRLEHRLERVFLKKMKPLAKKGWIIEVKHRADAFDLHEALVSESIDGVIWVSHGSFRSLKATHTAGGAIAAKPMLLDYRGDDVASVLSLRHDDLKFLSVVGCNSKQIMEYNDALDLDPEKSTEKIETYIPDHKIVAQWALRRATKKSVRFFSNSNSDHSDSQTSTVPVNSETITLVRKIPMNAKRSFLRPIRVYLGGKLIGVISKGQPGDNQSETFEIPPQIRSLPISKWKIRIETGQHVETAAAQIIFGSVTVHSERKIRWEIFADNEGIPFGQNFRLFLPFQSELAL